MTSTSTSTPVDELDWPRLLDAAVHDSGIEAHYQPIVDLVRGVVVGYEALARFPGPGPRGPDQWFSAARAAGRLAELEAAALRAALRHRDELPVNTFLTVNLGPDVLVEPLVRRTLEGAGRLDGVFIELTEHAPVGSWETLLDQLDRLREAGALIAMDDAGAGHAGLNTMLRLRPDLIKLDRDLVTDVHQDEAKRVLLEMVGTLADRLDAWLLAEGIETWAEAEVLARMGIPLGQGYFLARPARPWAGLDPATALKLMSVSRESDSSTLRYLLQSCATVSVHDPDVGAPDGSGPFVVLDVHSRPVALRDQAGVTTALFEDIKVNLDTPIAQAARRALTRANGRWSEVVVCTDNAGRYVGVVPMPSIVRHLAGAGRASGPLSHTQRDASPDQR